MNHQPTILLVDDVPANLTILELTLKDQWRLLTATSGREALALVNEAKPDLILLDVMMPEMDGYEMCRRLKAEPATRDIPVIFITAVDDLSSEEQGLRLGAIDYIRKPFTPAIVRARVRNHLNLKLYQDALEAARQQAQRDLAAAAAIQRTLLPSPRPPGGSGDFHWHFSPCEQVGGDLVAIIPWDQENCLFYLLDVSGHGPRAAMITVAVAQFLQPLRDKRAILPFLAPAAMIQQLEREFPLERFEGFLTMIYGVCHHPSRTIRYCNAGQPAPLLLEPDAPPRLLRESGSLVGMNLNRRIPEVSLDLSKGATALFYTDGLTDVLAPDGIKFGEEAWPRLRSQLRADTAEAVLNQVVTAVDEFRADTPLPDDLTILAIRGGRGHA